MDNEPCLSGGRLLATDSAVNGTQYHHPDRLGTRLVTHTSGAVVSENIGLPFGATITGESNNLAGSASKRRFTSYDRSDTTKLDYANNRHYSSAQGRFTQVDLVANDLSVLSNPQTLNLYTYCGNDPINYIDPSGLFFLPAIEGGAAVGGPVGAIVVAAVLAVVSALRLLFGGRAKTRMVGQVSNRLAQIETGNRGAWIRSSVWAGVGAVNSLLQKKSNSAKKNKVPCWLRILHAAWDIFKEDLRAAGGDWETQTPRTPNVDGLYPRNRNCLAARPARSCNEM